jgi:hypothetical protein
MILGKKSFKHAANTGRITGLTVGTDVLVHEDKIFCCETSDFHSNEDLCHGL